MGWGKRRQESVTQAEGDPSLDVFFEAVHRPATPLGTSEPDTTADHEPVESDELTALRSEVVELTEAVEAERVDHARRLSELRTEVEQQRRVVAGLRELTLQHVRHAS